MASRELIRLMSWLSPAFPTGGFAYSAALEQAVADGTVRDAATLSDWVGSLVARGGPRNDAILLAESVRRSRESDALRELAALALALTGSAERHREILNQGRSFALAARQWKDCSGLDEGLPLPIAVGAACGLADIEPEQAIGAYLHAFVSNQIQCAIRLFVIGQLQAAHVIASLESRICEASEWAAASGTEKLGTMSFMAEIAAMRHETLQPRLFLS